MNDLTPALRFSYTGVHMGNWISRAATVGVTVLLLAMVGACTLGILRG